MRDPFGRPRLHGLRPSRLRRATLKPGRNLVSDLSDDGGVIRGAISMRRGVFSAGRLRDSQLLDGEEVVRLEDGSIVARRHSLTRPGSYSDRRIDSSE